MTDPAQNSAPQIKASVDPNTRPGRILRAVLAMLGAGLIIIGVPIAIITPFPMIPIGLSIVIAGTVLVARNSITGRLWLARIVDRHPRLRKFMPNWLKTMIFGAR